MTAEPNFNETEPLRYRGGGGSKYVDIATRNTGEYIGIALNYATHSTGVGCFIVRFVAHGVEPGSLKHFAYRESTKFWTGQEYLKALRLNKVAIKVFSPAVYPWEIDQYALQFGIWAQLTEWIADQLIAEEFALTVDLQKTIRELLVPTAKVTAGDIKSVLEFPSLDTPEEKASAIKPSQSDGEDKDEDEEDKDDEDEDEKKDWLN